MHGTCLSCPWDHLLSRPPLYGAQLPSYMLLLTGFKTWWGLSLSLASRYGCPSYPNLPLAASSAPASDELQHIKPSTSSPDLPHSLLTQP
jgi:hypothetical protein